MHPKVIAFWRWIGRYCGPVSQTLIMSLRLTFWIGCLCGKSKHLTDQMRLSLPRWPRRRYGRQRKNSLRQERRGHLSTFVLRTPAVMPRRHIAAASYLQPNGQYCHFQTAPPICVAVEFGRSAMPNTGGLPPSRNAKTPVNQVVGSVLTAKDAAGRILGPATWYGIGLPVT